MLRIITLNVNGIRSAARKGFFGWLARSRADIACVQDLKAQQADLEPGMRDPRGLRGYFHFAEKKGYGGVGLYARREPDRVVRETGIREIDAEGRFLRADFGALSVVSVYLPSGSAGAHRQAAKFRFMDAFFPLLARLAEERREIVLCGDWNIAHREIDLKNWRSNRKHSGFLPEERAWLSRVFEELGWVDVYRRLHPDATAESYTWWSNRGRAWENNVGWRIDYQIATPGIAARARRATIYKKRRFSDHAPLTIEYDYRLA
jgi:exodeoxyribonuclease-3